MKKFNLLLLLLILATTTFAQVEYTLKGSEKLIYQEKTVKEGCYVYKKYVAKTTSVEDKGGEITKIYQQSEAIPSKKSCQVSGAPIITVSNSSGLKDGYDSEDVTHFFYGIHDKYLFIDKAVEPFQGAFEIFDLTTGKSIFKALVYPELKIIPTQIVFYENWAKKDGLEKNCLQAKKWKKQGLGIGWVDKFQFDLKTLKLKKVGLRCEATQ